MQFVTFVTFDTTFSAFQYLAPLDPHIMKAALNRICLLLNVFSLLLVFLYDVFLYLMEDLKTII